MVNVLELNDTDVSVYRDTERTYQAPAAVWLDANDPVIGVRARQHARLHPRHAHNAYFYRMNTDPLAVGIGVAQTQADLVYLHMTEIVRDAGLGNEPVIVAVPGHYTSEQLGVLLGIAQEAGLSIATFVDIAVAACAGARVPPEFHVVDLHQHMCTLSHMKAAADIETIACREVTGRGMSSLVDGWVKVIADQFVTETRFDPLHVADTEQQLYDQMTPLTGAGRADGAPAIGVELNADGYTRRVEVTPGALAEKSATRLQPLFEYLPADAHVVLTHRTAAALGVRSCLAARGHMLTVLEPDSLTRGIIANADRLTGDGGVRRIRQLKALDVEESVRAESTIAPTHVLCGTHAHRLPYQFDEIAFAMHGPEARISSHAPGLAVTVNLEPLAPDGALAAGDRVQTGGAEYTLIIVES